MLMHRQLHTSRLISAHPSHSLETHLRSGAGKIASERLLRLGVSLLECHEDRFGACHGMSALENSLSNSYTTGWHES